MSKKRILEGMKKFLFTEKKMNATLVRITGGGDSPMVHLTFEVKKEDLAGLEYTRPEFVLVITPAEKLFEQ